jgi:uncharacterized lipoprotein YddW (UPF0748 family)
MPTVGRPGRRRACLCLFACTLALWGVLALEQLRAASDSPAPPDVETRALLVERQSLVSPESLEAALATAQAARFNALLVDARALGELYFNQGLERRAGALAGQPAAFDPLAAAIAFAHARGMRVYARVSVSLVASAADVPADRAHLVNAHPERLMVPRALARDLALLKAGSQLFLDRLLRWTRAQPADIAGLYSSPASDEAADALVSLVADLASRYAVDGIHLEDVAYPTPEFDYSRATLEAFKADMLGGLDPEAKRERERAMGADLAAWPEAAPDRWVEFRRDRLTALVARIRRGIRLRRPEAVVSVAVVTDAKAAGLQHFQDWRAWSERRLLDVVCPTADTLDAAAFAAQIGDARRAAGETPMWVAIDASRLSTSETVDRIRAARQIGARGVIIGSYGSLMSQPDGLDYLTRVAREAFEP